MLRLITGDRGYQIIFPEKLDVALQVLDHRQSGVREVSDDLFIYMGKAGPREWLP